MENKILVEDLKPIKKEEQSIEIKSENVKNEPSEVKIESEKSEPTEQETKEADPLLDMFYSEVSLSINFT